ncbi:MAG TPA: hypothetical protein VFA74_05705 [Terriglobales bacterium]|nr:hypothetical protein [Terriglobales bacterium]
MRLAFDDRLIRTTHFDGEMSFLADRHYSRRTPGARQFLYSGSKLVLRNAEATVLFAWIWPDEDKRMDGQTGYNNAIFRNESERKAHTIILEAEGWAFAKWGPNRLYTYVDARKTKPIIALRDYPKWGIRRGERIVGFAYRKAGWKPRLHKNGRPHLSKAGQWLFVKNWHGERG